MPPKIIPPLEGEEDFKASKSLWQNWLEQSLIHNVSPEKVVAVAADRIASQGTTTTTWSDPYISPSRTVQDIIQSHKDAIPSLPFACALCNEDCLENDYFKDFFTPLYLPCNHAFCTRCVFTRLAGKIVCPKEGCSRGIPSHHQQRILDARRGWAVDQVLQEMKFEDCKDIVFQNLSLQRANDRNSPALQAAHIKAVEHLRGNTTPLGEQANEPAQNSISHLEPHIIAMANLIPLYIQSDQDYNFTEVQKRHWRVLVEQTHAVLSNMQARMHNDLAVVKAQDLLYKLPDDVTKGLMVNFDESGFMKKGTPTHRAVRILYYFVVVVCRDHYLELEQEKAKKVKEKGKDKKWFSPSPDKGGFA